MVAVQHPDVRIFAYLDDIYVVGKSAPALAATKMLTLSLAEIGLVINKAKSKVLNLHAVADPSAGALSADDPSEVAQSLRDSVSSLFVEDNDDDDNDSLSVCSDGLAVVGVPFGSLEFKQTFLAQEVAEWSRQLDCLDQLSSIQYKTLLLRWCLLSKANFLMRTVSPSVAQDTWQLWDTKITT